MNQPWKYGCSEGFGGRRGSYGDARTPWGSKLTVPPIVISAPTTETTVRESTSGDMLNECPSGATARPLVDLAPFIVCRHRGNHGNCQAGLPNNLAELDGVASKALDGLSVPMGFRRSLSPDLLRRGATIILSAEFVG